MPLTNCSNCFLQLCSNESQEYTNKHSTSSQPIPHYYQCLVPHNHTITQTHKPSFSQILFALEAQSTENFQERSLWKNIIYTNASQDM